MDVICGELRRSDIDIDIETLSFYIDEVYKKHGDLYREIVTRVCVDDFPSIWEAIHPRSFGHVISFLSMVHAADIDDDCRRVAVRNVVPLLRSIYIVPYRDRANRKSFGRWRRFRNAMSVLVPIYARRAFYGIGCVINAWNICICGIWYLTLWM